MDDKMTVEITGFDAEKHAEDAAKRATAYSEMTATLQLTVRCCSSFLKIHSTKRWIT